MAENPIANDCERRIQEAVCIDTKRIYDSCVSKDCLEDLRVTFFGKSQCLIDKAVTVKCRDCSIAAVSVDVDEVPFNRGYYSVNIVFYFKLRFDTYSEPCSNPQIAVGYTRFEKKCILYGSEGNVKIFTSSVCTDDLDCPEAPRYSNPVAKVQAVDPVVLQCDVLDACDCTVLPITSFPQSILKENHDSPMTPDCYKTVLVTLGLFSIVQMERDVQMLIPAYDYCIPERECNCTTQSPCETFQQIEFPVDEFFPAERSDDGCAPCKSEE